MAARNQPQGSTPSRGSQVRAGDSTGRERERKQAEHAEEVKAATARLGMSQSLIRDPNEMDDTIIDVTSGKPVEISLEDIEGFGDTDISQVQPDLRMDINDLEDGRITPGVETKTARPEEPRPVTDKPPTSRKAAVLDGDDDDAPLLAQTATVVMRVREDLEEVTIGRDQHFNFKVGKYYRVPRHVYDHLEEKGLTYH